MQVTYKEGGASYYVNDYFPHLHYQAAATLADENYDELVDWGVEYDSLREIDLSSNSVEELVRGGAFEDISELF